MSGNVLYQHHEWEEYIYSFDKEQDRKKMTLIHVYMYLIRPTVAKFIIPLQYCSPLLGNSQLKAIITVLVLLIVLRTTEMMHSDYTKRNWRKKLLLLCHFAVSCTVLNALIIIQLKAAQNSILMGHYTCTYFSSLDATIMMPKNCPIIGEHVVINFVTQQDKMQLLAKF